MFGIGKKKFNPFPVAKMEPKKEIEMPSIENLFKAQLESYCRTRFTGFDSITLLEEDAINKKIQDVEIVFKDGTKESKKLVITGRDGLLFRLTFMDDITVKKDDVATPDDEDVVTAEKWMTENYAYIIEQKSKAGDEIFIIPLDMLPDDEAIIMEISEAIMNSGAFGGTFISEEGLSVLPLAA